MTEANKGGVIVEKKRIIACADDSITINSEQAHLEMMKKLEYYLEKKEFTLIVNKTKIMEFVETRGQEENFLKNLSGKENMGKVFSYNDLEYILCDKNSDKNS